MDVKFYSLAETKHILRSTLRRAFPRTHFRIYDNDAPNRAVIDVMWKDGPSLPQVQFVAESFEGNSCPGLSYLKVRDPEVEFDGQLVSFGVDYIHCLRRHTRPLVQTAAAQVASECHLPPLTVTGRGKLLGGQHDVPFRFSPYTRSFSYDNTPGRRDTYASLVLSVINGLSLEGTSPVMLPRRLGHTDELPFGILSRVQLAEEIVAIHLRRAEKAQKAAGR